MVSKANHNTKGMGKQKKTLSLERVLWESTVWIDDKQIASPDKRLIYSEFVDMEHDVAGRWTEFMDSDFLAWLFAQSRNINVTGALVASSEYEGDGVVNLNDLKLLCDEWLNDECGSCCDCEGANMYHNDKID